MDTLHQLVKWGFVVDTGVVVFFSYIDGIARFWSSDFTVFICHVLLLIILLIQRMKASRCPTDELSLSNCAVVNKEDFPDDVK